MKTCASIPAVLFCFSINLYAAYSGGAGTTTSPYQIATKANLLTLAATTADYSKCFILTADIDMEGQTFTTAIIAPDTISGSSFEGTAFTGVFDGNGHKITNFTINGGSNDYLGLFGYIGSGTQIKNLGIENCTISGSSGSYYIGGLAGSTYNCSIRQCYSTGTAGGSYYVGGMVGWCRSSNIFQSYSTMSLSGSYENIGGLIGKNDNGAVIACYATGSINNGVTYTSAKYVGGLIGYNANGIIEFCHATGAVTGQTHVGGLVGYNDYGSISQCYSRGGLHSGYNQLAGSKFGGLIGYALNVNYVAESFWDTQTSGMTTSYGGTGQTTAQMQDPNTFLSAGWDFINETANGTCNYWQMPGGGGYPVLSVFNGYVPPQLPGGGTEDAPYLIADANDLGTIWYRPRAYYTLTRDIDLTGIQWSVGVIPWFRGGMDGNGFCIRNLSINGGNNLGLFGYTGSDSQICNLGLESVNIAGYGNIGGLIGYNSGNIMVSNCHSAGTVSGSFNVGGLAGYNVVGCIVNCYAIGTVSGSSNSMYIGGLLGYSSTGSISNCYSTSTVSGSFNVGGLTGYNKSSSITSCYSTGTISGFSGSQYIGGLVGYNFSGSSIGQCYSTGVVIGTSSVGGLVGYNSDSSVNGCFWDTEASGQTTSAGGEGKTTAQMQDIDTFLAAGWDFTNETTNGTCNYWQMPNGGGYPALSVFNGYVPPQLPGSGTEDAPYLIADANNLGTIWYRPSAYYALADNIDIAGIQWSVAVVPIFDGILDGKGFHIKNLSIVGGGYAGLFGRVNAGSTVKNLGIEDCQVSGNCKVGGLAGYNRAGSIISHCHSTGFINGLSGSKYMGGLVGYNESSVSSCYSAGTVNCSSGSQYIGGLVGYNSFYGSSISQCYSAGIVSGSADVGGLAGYNDYNISQSYSTSSVSGNSYVGGLAGSNGKSNGSSKISESYSIGSVSGSSYVGGLVGDNYSGNVDNSFWDTQTSGRTTSDGGTGKTTAQMKTLSTFTDAGWDFSATDGDAADWMMLRENEDYPRLAWQTIIAGDIAGLYGVNMADYKELSMHWLQTGCPAGCENADINADGTVDTQDLLSLADHWLEGI